MKNKLREALNIFALQNMEGKVSDDLLVKACDAYKIKSDDFLDDYDYHVCVAKSLYDHLHGIEPDEDICKAVVPGQTKVVDGVMYIYTATPNAKDPNKDIITGIYQAVSDGYKEAIGTYAALKGYDAIIEPHGNGGPNSFMVILNRSKVIVKQ